MMKIIILLCLLLYLASNSFASELNPTCQNKKIVAYTKKNCIYCIKLKQALEEAKVTFIDIEITNNDLLRNWLISKTKANTVPYVFLENEYIGGYNDFMKKCIYTKKSK